MTENRISKDELQKELDYYMAVTFNDLLLEKGLISEEIHDRARREFIYKRTDKGLESNQSVDILFMVRATSRPSVY